MMSHCEGTGGSMCGYLHVQSLQYQILIIAQSHALDVFTFH